MRLKIKTSHILSLKLLLIALMTMNMSWIQQLISTDSPQQNQKGMNEFSSNSPDVAPGRTAPPGTATYDRVVDVRKGKEKRQIRWDVRVTKTTTVSRTDPFGGTIPSEDAFEVSARSSEGCYGPHCQITKRFRKSEIGNAEGFSEIMSQIQQKLDPELDRLSQDHVKKEVEEEKEAKRLEKLEKDIDHCRIDPETEKPFKSKFAQLECRAEKLGGKDGDEAEESFEEVREDLRSFLMSSNPRQREKARELLKTMGDDGGLSRSMRTQLNAMAAGSYYNEQYPQALQTFLTTTNPMQRQRAQGHVLQMEQRMRVDSNRFGQSEFGGEEFEYWRTQLQNNIDLVLKDPRAPLQQFSDQGLQGAGNGSDVLANGAINIQNRLSRGGGSGTSVYNSVSGSSSGNPFWRGTGANYRSPIYDSTNPQQSYRSNTTSNTRLGIPQMGQRLN